MLLAAAALAAVAIVLLSGGKAESEAELGQQRAHLAFVAGELYKIEGPVQREVAASQAAWPLVDHGLPAKVDGRLLGAASAASAAAAAVPSPSFLSFIHELTGPGARIARLFRSFSLLSSRGWAHTVTAAKTISRGEEAAAFDRANAGLYIESAYDGNFDLSLIGERVLNSYERLGAGPEFGSALTPREVESIVKAYSPEADELTPHPWQALLAQR